nr:leucine rich repeat containing protein 48 [Hymenolepis microstoma]
MSQVDTYVTTKKDFRFSVAEFRRAKNFRSLRAHGKSEPTVINEELLTYAVFAQGPKGEAGRLSETEGIAFDSVKRLELSYKNVLTITGLSQFCNLTELLLDNNIIEKIEGLNSLVNLKRLDLSFNSIHRIENLENLVHLEDLSLFHNSIEKIENMDMNRKLRYLSLGHNKIDNLENIVYLRKLKNLDCLTLQVNPVTEEPEYNKFIYAFLPSLKYLDHKKITPENKAEAYETYAIAVEKLNQHELNVEIEEKQEEERQTFMKICKAAFIDRIYGDTLFEVMFEKDTDGKQLFQVPLLKEIVDQYKEKFVEECAKLFQSGLSAYHDRQSEEEALRERIKYAKQESKDQALILIETYETKKTAIFKRLNEMEPEDYVEFAEPHLAKIRQCIHELWNDLMTNEMVFMDQTEEVINEFERNLEEKVATFVETIQAGFAKLRDAVELFNERLSEMALLYTEKSSKSEVPLDQSYAIFADRENVLSALGNSKEAHLNVIDSAEERIIKSTRVWFDELMTNLHEKEEKERHKNRVVEINLYIDAQRVDLESLDLTLV